MPPPIHSVSAAEISLSEYDAIIDVRSPAEHAEDGLPGAVNLPVLDDEERARVGTLYKQVGPFEARRLGAGLVSANIARHIAGPLADRPRVFRPLIYCWRGGERSQAMATVLASIGWKVTLLEGGYRAYRRFIIEELESIAERDPPFTVIAGLTGSGKTRLLQRLSEGGAQVLDLEGLAEHRGSALGENIERAQPSQKRFENLLFETLRAFDLAQPVYTESESSRIGKLQIPAAIWAQLRAAPLVELQVPLAARAAHLIEDYRHFVRNAGLLAEKLEPLRGMQPAQRFEAWRAAIEAGDWKTFVESILEHHYDPAYLRSREKIYAGERRCVSLDRVSDTELDRAVEAIQSAPPESGPQGTEPGARASSRR